MGEVMAFFLLITEAVFWLAVLTVLATFAGTLAVVALGAAVGAWRDWKAQRERRAYLDDCEQVRARAARLKWARADDETGPQTPVDQRRAQVALLNKRGAP